MIAGFFYVPKRTKPKGITFFISRKSELKKTPVFSSYFNPKIVGDNRFSEQIFIETVCWVPPVLSHLAAEFRQVENGKSVEVLEVGKQMGYSSPLGIFRRKKDLRRYSSFLVLYGIIRISFLSSH